MPQSQAATSLDDDSRELICLIHGDSNVFQVTAPVNKNIMDLKNRIRKNGFRVEQDILAKDLVLWKVSAS